MAKVVAQSIRLTPQRDLFDPDFEGYKLSSDGEVTAYSRATNEGVRHKACQSTCYLHTRLQALHNHLFQDPFHPLSVYYFNTRGHLVKCSYSEGSRLSEGEVTWQAEAGEAEAGEGEYYYPPTLKFPSPEVAVVTDGRGRLSVLRTEDRTTARSWVVSFEAKSDQGVLADACVRGDNRELHCLVVSVTSPKKLHQNPDYVLADDAFGSKPDLAVHLMRWLTLSQKGSGWEESRSRAVTGQGVLEYCAVDSEGAGLLLLCHANYFFVRDSVQPITKPDPKPEKSSPDQPKFTFQQNDEDITVWLKTGSATKDEVEVKIAVNTLEVLIEATSSLQARFLHPVKADLATWTMGEGKLELVLPKASEGEKWQSLFSPEDDVLGEEVLDPARLEEINQNLAHLASDKLNPDPSLDKPAYDPGQLEECDTAREDLLLVRLDGSSHHMTNYGQLGATQHLFNLQVDETSVPAFCIRHDVDAVLWQPKRQVQFSHLANYHAFGYVRASKTTAKYTCGAPDLSYVAIAEVRSHVYLFFQPEALEGELRNRKSGHRTNRVSRQLLISLKNHSEVLGLCASLTFSLYSQTRCFEI
ncbi:NudC domain-containing protein 1 [Chionoecetes opilio]|uniref:NudC domain-containing protein 1 n=1 Tax=Chionoecetes opilio TaxID=41210 RepID=A0A8J4YIH5_CHIOP|nr:NudC domain-containing protein 1 [Chionoecetes opilio]